MSFEWLTSELVGLEHEFFGGVKDGDVRAASIAVGLSFPPSYVAFLRQFGCGFISYQELIGLGGPRHLDVVVQTDLLRRESRISRFPAHLVPVLADGFGNYECLDASRSGSASEFPVVLWLHDGGDDQTPRTLAASYEEWMRGLILQIRSVEAEDRE